MTKENQTQWQQSRELKYVEGQVKGLPLFDNSQDGAQAIGELARLHKQTRTLMNSKLLGRKAEERDETSISRGSIS